MNIDQSSSSWLRHRQQVIDMACSKYNFKAILKTMKRNKAKTTRRVLEVVLMKKQTNRCAHKLLDTFLFMKILPEQDTRMSELHSTQYIPQIPIWKTVQLGKLHN